MVTKRTTKKSKKVDEQFILEKYISHVLAHGLPANVYQYCKANDIQETDFYTFYGSFEALQQDIWLKFFENTKQTLEADTSYEGYSQKNKLLTFYFTFFEVLTLNRSYVVFALKANPMVLQNLKQLTLLRNHFKDFVVSIMETQSDPTDKSLHKTVAKVVQEGAWVQLMMLLKFWMDDTSKGFEKTDVMIEKMVKATFDLMDTTPLESLLDLGKFVWKEKFN